MILGISLSSCETEDLNTMTALDEVAGKAKITSDDSRSADENCETAFGRFCPCANLNTCFIDMDYGINRWGWSVHLVNETNEPMTERFGLYAGVGQCDMSKGTPVGHVYVTYHTDGTVTYEDPVIKSGYQLKEFHFYAGDTEVPMVRRGKELKATVADGRDGVYVILHAVVCGDFED